MTRLKDIAEIRSGYPFRRGIEASADGKYRIVQIKDVAGFGELDELELVRTDIADVRPDQFVKPGDVLFGSRGSRKHALAVTTVPYNAVFSYQVFAIQTRENVLPEFLSWYINQQPAQRYIEENSMGSYVTTISKATLADMSVAVPPMEVQKRIVEVFRLFESEKALVRRIEGKRAGLIDAALLSAAKSETPKRKK
jgi:restriction endonuclease S subunit